MDCREAQRRLTGSHRDGGDIGSDRSLRKHLAECPACAQYAQAAGLLSRLFSAASADDDLDVRELASQRTLIEARAKQPRVLRKLRIPLWKRPAFDFGLAAAAIAVAVVALIPFSYHQVVGYEVAVDGIEQQMVENSDHICDMLFDLGLHEADVELLGCESTCAVTVYHLKSESEARLVAAVFNRIDPHQITADVKPVKEKSSATLLHQANQKLLDGMI